MPGLSVVHLVATSSQGDSGIGPVVIAVGLTLASVLVLSWLIGKLPGSNESTGDTPLFRRQRNPFDEPPDDTIDPPSRGTFDR